MTAHPEMPPLFVLRHGETEWNRAGRMQGRLDSPLTPRGVTQARAQGRILSSYLTPETAIRVSPSPRAWRTAEIALPDRTCVEDARLMEVDLGDWSGRTLPEIEAMAPFIAEEQDPHMWKFMAPGGERLDEMTARCAAVLAELDGPTVLVTHGLTSRILRCLALGQDPLMLSDLPGGQGVVHHVIDGAARLLQPEVV